MAGHKLPFLKRPRARPFKVTLPAPSNFIFASYKPGITDTFYPTHAALLTDLVEIVRDEIQWLVSEGVTTLSSTRPTTPTTWTRPASAQRKEGHRPVQRTRRSDRRGQRRDSWRPPRRCHSRAARLPRQQPQPLVHRRRLRRHRRKTFRPAGRGPLSAGIRLRARRQIRPAAAGPEKESAWSWAWSPQRAKSLES